MSLLLLLNQAPASPPANTFPLLLGLAISAPQQVAPQEQSAARPLPVAYSAAVSEAVALAEGVAATYRATVQLADSLSISEAIAARFAAKPATSETLTLSDAVAVWFAAQVSLTESVTLSELLAATSKIKAATMPITPDSGRDIALVRNPATGAFDSFSWDATNNPTFDDSDSHTVLSLLLEDEGGYWADQTGTRGSKLLRINLDKTGTDVQLAAAAEKALAPAVADGRLRSATAAATRKRPGRYDLVVRYKNRQGHSQSTRLPIGS